MGILRQLAAGGATTVMHGLVNEEELRSKAAAVSKEYGTTVGTSTANLLKPQEIRCAAALIKSTGRASRSGDSHRRRRAAGAGQRSTRASAPCRALFSCPQGHGGAGAG